MDFLASFGNALVNKTELNYNELNENINKLICDLGETIKKEIIVNE